MKIDQLLSLFSLIYPHTCGEHVDKQVEDCAFCSDIDNESFLRMKNDGITEVGDYWSANFAAWLKEVCGYDLFDVYFTGVEHVSL